MGRSRFPDPQITWTEEDARIALDQWRRSGESLAAFARKHGVTAPRLSWWRTRFDKREGSAGLISLVPAEVISDVEASGARGRVVVRLANEVTIDLGDSSPGWVAALIRELVRPR